MSMTLTCPCLFGLEGLLADEMRDLGFEGVSAENGRVQFKGGILDIAKANIGLRTAERVLIVLGTFKAVSFEQLFQGVSKIALEDYISIEDAFPVKGWSIDSVLHSVPDCQSIIKKAAAKRLCAHYATDWMKETGTLKQLQFSILKDTVTIMLDTSGAPLYKRGYRQEKGLAPIRETLAAGIVDVARVWRDTTLFDPMCGSGTLLIEGALRAMHIAPGQNRGFAAEQYGDTWKDAFVKAREELKSLEDREGVFKATGYDINKEAVAVANKNAQRAGVADRVKFYVGDVKDFSPEDEKLTLLCNPPYGERLLDINSARMLYKIMGSVMPVKKGCKYYIISPDDEFENLFGRKADKKRKLYNASIKCQLFMYFK